MTSETVVTILCGLAILVGVAGTIIPVLPGSVLIGVSLLAWAIWGGAGTAGWVVFAVAMIFVAAGHDRRRRAHRPEAQAACHPQPQHRGGAGGGRGGHVHHPRRWDSSLVSPPACWSANSSAPRNFPAAARSSWAALKATGLGMLAEFGLACLAASTWVIGVWIAAAGQLTAGPGLHPCPVSMER